MVEFLLNTRNTTKNKQEKLNWIQVNCVRISDKNKKYLSKEYPTVLEIKSKSQSEFDRWMRERWKGFNDAASQLTVYMTLKALENIRLDDFTNDDFDNLGMGLESLYVVKNRNTGFCDKFTQ